MTCHDKLADRVLHGRWRKSTCKRPGLPARPAGPATRNSSAGADSVQHVSPKVSGLDVDTDTCKAGGDVGRFVPFSAASAPPPPAPVKEVTPVPTATSAPSVPSAPRQRLRLSARSFFPGGFSLKGCRYSRHTNRSRLPVRTFTGARTEHCSSLARPVSTSAAAVSRAASACRMSSSRDPARSKESRACASASWASAMRASRFTSRMRAALTVTPSCRASVRSSVFRASSARACEKLTTASPTRISSGRGPFLTRSSVACSARKWASRERRSASDGWQESLTSVSPL